MGGIVRRMRLLPILGLTLLVGLGLSACGSSTHTPNATTSTTASTTTTTLKTETLPPTAYVADGEGPALTPVDLANGTLGAPFAVPYGAANIAITPNGKTAYLIGGTIAGNPATGVTALTPIDLTTGTAATPIPVPGNPNAEAIAIAPKGQTAWLVTNGTGGSDLISMNLASGAAGATIALNPPAGDSVSDIAITPNGDTAYVVSAGPSTEDVPVTPIDLATGIVGAPIMVDGGSNDLNSSNNPSSNPSGIAITPNGSTAYVASGGYVVPIDLSTGTVGAPITVPGGGWAIAITPNGTTAYVNSVNADAIIPIDLATGAIGTTIQVSAGAGCIAIAP